jgi:hypothetical protein
VIALHIMEYHGSDLQIPRLNDSTSKWQTWDAQKSEYCNVARNLARKNADAIHG